VVKARVKTHLELKQTRDLLVYQALYDGLTGLFTRRRFDELLISEWNRCLRYQLSISLIMIDIDHFKLYNDHYGHPEGDACLRSVTKTLAGVLKRSSDFIARYGGEEFTALLSGTDEAGAKTVAKKMQDAVVQLKIPHAHSSVSDWVSISMGVATMRPVRGFLCQELVNQADHRLYAAKANGRNQYQAVSIDCRFSKPPKTGE